MDRSDIRPPGAYWVKMDADSGFSPDDSYCSYRRCSPFQECENNRKTVYWDGNVDWDDYLPEIVAPGHRPLADVENGFFAIEPGTSYSTAVVSGSIATILSELFPNVPSPQRIKRSVEASAQELDCGIVGKLDMKELYRTLS